MTKKIGKKNTDQKKMKAMKTINSILCMVALVIAGTITTGCSNDDIIADNPVTADNDNIVTLTTTISLEGDEATTRALTADGRKTFDVDDQVAVFYIDASNHSQRKVSQKLTANDISNNGKSATITVSLSSPKSKSKIRIVYPAAMAKSSIEMYNSVQNDTYTIDYDKLKEQDGTLATIGSEYSLATYDGTLNGTSLQSYTRLTNRLAICEFTVKNGNNDITNSVTKLSVTNGTNGYLVSRPVGEGPIYVAMQPVSSGDIIIGASDGTNHYQKIVSGKTLEQSNIYPVRVSMAEPNAKMLDFITADYTAQNGETLTGTLHSNVKISIAEGATVTLSNVLINGTNNYNYQWAGITCLGNATLVLNGINSVTGFHKNFPGIQPGGTGATLTIQGSGSLTARSNGYGAGIGSKNDGTCGNITISGGTINATGSENSAGIGTGWDGTCGNITINGGTVTATGKHDGAGIGASYGGTCGNITISGTANVTTIGEDDGAGIGCSFCNSTCGNILIEGGTVVCSGSISGAAIGSANSSNCGTITITQSVTSITADITYGVDNIIGRGRNDSGSCGTVTIDGVTNATPSSTFEHFNSVLSNDNRTWTLTHK